MNNEKTHYRKAFNSPYLSSADIVGETELTISHVVLSGDASKKSKDVFNTAYFVEKEIRKGEKLKPMILNATNSTMLYKITCSHFLEDWQNVRVTVMVDKNVRFGRDTVEGLRIKPAKPRARITPNNQKMWGKAKEAFIKYKNLDNVLAKHDMTQEHQQQLINEVNNNA